MMSAAPERDRPIRKAMLSTSVSASGEISIVEPVCLLSALYRSLSSGRIAEYGVGAVAVVRLNSGTGAPRTCERGVCRSRCVVVGGLWDTRSSRQPEEVEVKAWMGRASKNSCARINGVVVAAEEGTKRKSSYQITGRPYLLVHLSPFSMDSKLDSGPQRRFLWASRRGADASMRYTVSTADESGLNEPSVCCTPADRPVRFEGFAVQGGQEGELRRQTYTKNIVHQCPSPGPKLDQLHAILFPALCHPFGDDPDSDHFPKHLRDLGGGDEVSAAAEGVAVGGVVPTRGGCKALAHVDCEGDGAIGLFLC